LDVPAAPVAVFVAAVLVGGERVQLTDQAVEMRQGHFEHQTVLVFVCAEKCMLARHHQIVTSPLLGWWRPCSHSRAVVSSVLTVLVQQPSLVSRGLEHHRHL
jgi:hypothetical protein